MSRQKRRWSARVGGWRQAARRRGVSAHRGTSRRDRAPSFSSTAFRARATDTRHPGLHCSSVSPPRRIVVAVAVAVVSQSHASFRPCARHSSPRPDEVSVSPAPSVVHPYPPPVDYRLPTLFIHLPTPRRHVGRSVAQQPRRTAVL